MTEEENTEAQQLFTTACAHLFMNMMGQLEGAYEQGVALSNNDLGDLVEDVKGRVMAIYEATHGEPLSEGGEADFA